MWGVYSTRAFEKFTTYRFKKLLPCSSSSSPPTEALESFIKCDCSFAFELKGKCLRLTHIQYYYSSNNYIPIAGGGGFCRLLKLIQVLIFGPDRNSDSKTNYLHVTALDLKSFPIILMISTT